ncbi:DNA polymerase III subunit gamma/tau [Coleofasciculus sp. FACHB-1120]|uniref:DNA polymerase III subunit gamma/tau n=1 Tax=Coleofasciculus sp. FACHB-1120 TaxID=2692783 RepID=UPI0016861519|nr:DNA polymerase III subunit gamma/tau [Coleofasciculus sp. FACHB-1120]
MTYQPLHHKYRPQTFADLVGQEAIAHTLRNAIRTERIAPAYLFTGSRGTGKTSSARILAKSLNCLQNPQPTEHPCGVCPVCQGIAKGSALDVIEIDAASNTGVDNIREIIERAQYAPVQCRYKVYVIDEVHSLSSAAFNALLKTLEEPPNHVVFVLATTDPQRVLPTIISRCQRFDFRRIPLEAMVGHLGKIAQLENINITSEAITLVSQVAQGGLRDAESLLDQLSLLSGQVTVEAVWDLVGAVPERDLMELLKAIADSDPEAVLEKARHLMDRGREPLIVLQNLAGFYRDLLIAKTAPKRPDLVAVTAPTWTQLCEFAELDIPTILQGQKHLKDSEVQIRNTTQPRLWLEVTLLGLLPAANSGQQTQAVGNVNLARPRVERQEAKVERGSSIPNTPHSAPAQPATPAVKTPPPSVSPIQQESPPETPPETSPVSAPPPEPQESTEPPAPVSHPVEGAEQGVELAQVWQQVINHVQLLGTREFLRQRCRLLNFNGREAILSVSTTGLLKLAQTKLPDVEAAFLKTFQSKVKVSFQVAGETELKSNPVSKPPTSQRSDSLGTSPSQNSVGTIASGTPAPQSAPVQPSGETQKENGASNYSAPPSTSSSSNLPPQAKHEFRNGSSTASRTSAATAQPSAPSSGEWDDEVAIAAKRLADFFKGEIVKLADEGEENLETLDLPSLPAMPTSSSLAEMINPADELSNEWEEDDDVGF